jgi:hypothetical protein
MARPNRDGEHLDRRLIGVAVMRRAIANKNRKGDPASYSPVLRGAILVEGVFGAP